MPQFCTPKQLKISWVIVSEEWFTTTKDTSIWKKLPTFTTIIQTQLTSWMKPKNGLFWYNYTWVLIWVRTQWFISVFLQIFSWFSFKNLKHKVSNLLRIQINWICASNKPQTISRLILDVQFNIQPCSVDTQTILRNSYTEKLDLTKFWS